MNTEIRQVFLFSLHKIQMSVIKRILCYKQVTWLEDREKNLCLEQGVSKRDTVWRAFLSSGVSSASNKITIRVKVED